MASKLASQGKTAGHSEAPRSPKGGTREQDVSDEHVKNRPEGTSVGASPREELDSHGHRLEKLPKAHLPGKDKHADEPVSPDGFHDQCLDPCRITRFPADRLVRSATFVPASAEYSRPTANSGTSSKDQSKTASTKALRAASENRADLHEFSMDRGSIALVEAVRSLDALLTRTGGQDVEQTYLAAVTERHLDADMAVALGLVYQELGYLFLDQIRLRPCGAVVGDLVFTLGLAPKERVVLTQRAWTKRNISIEDMLDKSLESTIELSSAFSTEIGENTERQSQTESSSNLNVGVSGGYGGVNASVGYGQSASDGSTITAQQTARRSREQTRKVTDHAKKEHRITFKLETETGVEDVSQRTYENPNTSRSLMLNFYRVYQQFHVSLERWGVRACWAPCVRDPGRDLRPSKQVISPVAPQMTPVQKAYIEAARTSWMPPDMPPKPETETRTSQWSIKVHSGIFGYRDDVKTTIDIPADYTLVDVRFEKSSDMSWGTVDFPWSHSNPNPGATGPQDVWWHVGLANCVVVITPEGTIKNCPEPWGMVRTQFDIAPVSTYVDGWAKNLQDKREAEYQRRVKEVEDQIKAATQAQTTGQTAGGSSYDPWTELMRRVVAERLSSDRYNSCTEVALWNTAFEWENAAYELFPTWWSGLPADGEQSKPISFENASWARLYIPIRPGMEAVALRLIFGAKAFGPKAGKLPQFVDDLNTFRQKTFGDPSHETVLQVAEWQEFMPTDGTYVEPVLGKCEGCDEEQLADLRAQRALVRAQAKALEKV